MLVKPEGCSSRTRRWETSRPAGSTCAWCATRQTFSNRFFEFLPPYMGIPSGVITPEEFCDAIFAGASHSGDVWGHFRGWWDMGVDDDCEQSSMLFKNASDGDRNVFITSFEDMKNDLPTVVRRVGAFMKTEDDSGDLSEHDVTSVCEMCDFKFMRRNSEKFDDHFVRREMWRRIQIPEHEWAGGGVGKVREGGGGGWGGGGGFAGIRTRKNRREVGRGDETEGVS